MKRMILAAAASGLTFLAGCGASPAKPGAPEPADPVKAIRANAQLVVDTMKADAGVELRFDAESVKWLDGYIERNRNQLDAATKSKLGDVFGSYLGEALVRTYGGQWEQYQDTWCVSFGKDNKAFPFAKVAKQFKNGSEDSIYSFFCAVPAVFKLVDKKAGAGSPVSPESSQPTTPR
jgi:hypothetical protein